MLEPTPLQPGQGYATIADIRDCPDLPRMPVTPGITRSDGGFEPFWTRPDGTPLTILVRAPSHTERREINQAAGDSDDDFILETCASCIIAEPALTREQLKEILRDKNPAVLEQISDTAWQLATLPAGLVEREVRRLAGLPKEKRRAARKRAVVRGVAEATQPEVRPPDR